MRSNIVDLRSDTVTAMTAEMRAAMATADTEDMLYGADRNINELEGELASLFGMTCVWVPSCTMANLVSVILLSKGAGSELIVGRTSHINALERRNGALAGGVAYKPLPDEDGRLNLEDVRNAIVPESEFFSSQFAIAVENTHNLAGGVAFSPEYLAQLCVIARDNGLRVHMDGARIFNASVACEKKLSAWALNGKGPDTIAVSLSKALGTPAGGAVLLKDEVDAVRVRRIRKSLGGTMHTGAGYLAAAALGGIRDRYYSTLEPEIRLDHRRARLFARELAAVPGYRVLNRVDTNIVYVAVDAVGAPEIAAKLEERGLLCSILSVGGFMGSGPAGAPSPIRFVFHRGVDDDDVERSLQALKDVVRRPRRPDAKGPALLLTTRIEPRSPRLLCELGKR